MDKINIGCRRTPWNMGWMNDPIDNKTLWWAYMIEDQCDGYGATAGEAIGNLMIQIAKLHKVMPYIQSIVIQEEKNNV